MHPPGPRSSTPSDTIASRKNSLVVQCHACATRFALDPAVVAGISEPRFHCSRCDHVFTLSIQDSLRSSHEESNRFDFEDPHPASNGGLARQVTQASSYQAPSLQGGGVGSLSREERANSTIPTPIQQSEFSLGTSTSPISKAQDVPKPKEVSKTGPIEHPKFVAKEESIEEAAEKSPPKPRPVDLPDKAKKGWFAPLTDAVTRPGTDRNTESAVGRHAREQGPVDQIVSPRSPIQFSQLSPLTLAVLPLFAAVAVLLLFSYIVWVSPGGFGVSVTRTFPGIGKSLPALPPKDLATSQVAIQFVKLQSKELVPVISGVVTNYSTQPIEGVTLQALGFDERGEVLISAEAPLRSALSREKVSELSITDVARFQTSLSARKSSIAPSETVPFTIALLEQDGSGDPKLDRIKYFSARVFSIAGG